MGTQVGDRTHGGKGMKASTVRAYVSRRVRLIREEVGLSQSAAARASGCSRYAWARYERNKTTVPSEVLCLFARHLKRSTDDFFPPLVIGDVVAANDAAIESIAVAAAA